MRIRTQNIDGNLQVNGAVVLCRRHISIAEIDLQRRDDELRHTQTRIALRSPLDELLLGGVVRQLLVLGLLLSNGRLILELTSTGLIIVPNKHPRLIRQRVKLLDAGIQIVRRATGEIASGRSHIGHEHRISSKDRISNHIANARWGVAYRMGWNGETKKIVRANVAQ